MPFASVERTVPQFALIGQSDAPPCGAEPDLPAVPRRIHIDVCLVSQAADLYVHSPDCGVYLQCTQRPLPAGAARLTL
jgi:hypothetical protein